MRRNAGARKSRQTWETHTRPNLSNIQGERKYKQEGQWTKGEIPPTCPNQFPTEIPTSADQLITPVKNNGTRIKQKGMNLIRLVLGGSSKTTEQKAQQMRQLLNTDKHLKYLYNMGKNGEIDRRYMIYIGPPLPDTTHGPIYYQGETQLRHCTKCTRTENRKTKEACYTQSPNERRKRKHLPSCTACAWPDRNHERNTHHGK